MSIDKFFAAIKDGAWHSIDELSEQLGFPIGKLTEFINFLSEHGLLKQDDKTNRIKIEPIWRLLLPEEEGEPPETKTTVATFIIPPETSVDVQSTRFSNVSNVELEVSLRMNTKIKEVAIKI